MTDTPQPLTDVELAAIRARFERTTHPDWRDVSDTGRLLADLGRLRAELATARNAALTEGAELIREHLSGLDDGPWWDTRDRDTAINLLLAARDTTS